MKKGRTEQFVTKTLMPNLVNLIDDGAAGGIKYLTKEDGRVSINDYLEDNGIRTIPKQTLPIKYASDEVLSMDIENLDCKQLLEDTISFIKKYLELPYEEDYLILTLWVFQHTLVLQMHGQA